MIAGSAVSRKGYSANVVRVPRFPTARTLPHVKRTRERNEKETMRINPATLIGILLIVAGAIALAVKGISYTTEEEILDIGPIQATAETEREFAIPTWAAALALGLGVVIVIVGVRGRPS
jgi:hypothetical protein